MVGFKISINGHHVRTVSVGEFGSLTADVMWSRIQTVQGHILEGIVVGARGLTGDDGDAVDWPKVELKLGDSVTITALDVADEGDPPAGRMSREELRAAAAALNG